MLYLLWPLALRLPAVVYNKIDQFQFLMTSISTNFDGTKKLTRVKFVPFLLVVFAVCFSSEVVAQKKSAWVTGRVVGENEQPLDNVSVVVLGRLKGTVTSDSGTFRLRVPADKAFAIVFSYTGFKTEQRNSPAK